MIIVAVALVASTSAAGRTQATITGTIRDVQGQAVTQATVSDAELGMKTHSDQQGTFSLAVSSNVDHLTLLFEAASYYSQTVMVKLESANPVLEVTLTPRTMVQQDVEVIASRLDIPLEVNPAATTVVVPETLAAMAKGINAAEAMNSVPGMKIDDQANGERVHVSIRGQGILSEHGLRGIEVLLEGIPLSDPTGFVSDLFDVDWNGVEEIQVLRGPVASLYGGSSAAGVIEIHMRQPEDATHGSLWATGGSHDFYKARGEITGTARDVGYALALSRTQVTDIACTPASTATSCRDA